MYCRGPMLIAVSKTEMVILHRQVYVLFLIIIACQTHAEVIRLSVFVEFRRKHPNDFWFHSLFKRNSTNERTSSCITWPVPWKMFLCNIYYRIAMLYQRSFPLNFSFKFRRVFVRISSSIDLIIQIRTSLERSLFRAEFEYKKCQLWSKMMTSEVEQRTKQR